MTAYRCSLFGATALLAIAGCRGDSGPKVLLRYRPPAGAAYHYAFEQQNTVRVEGAGPATASAPPAQTFNMRIYYTQQVKGPAPAPGGVAVTTTFDSTTLDGPGAGAMKPELARLRGMRSDLVYDDRMRVMSAAFSGLAGAPSPLAEQLAAIVKSMALGLPESPVGVGVSWVSEQETQLGGPINPSNPIKTRTKFTVRQVLVAGPDTSVLLGAETTFRRGQVSGGLTGAEVFSLTRSVPARVTQGGTMRMNGKTLGRSEKTIALSQRTSLRLVGGK
jgi:hypothetical protein